MCGCWVVSNSFALLWSYLNSHDWLNHWGAQVEFSSGGCRNHYSLPHSSCSAFSDHRSSTTLFLTKGWLLHSLPDDSFPFPGLRFIFGGGSLLATTTTTITILSFTNECPTTNDQLTSQSSTHIYLNFDIIRRIGRSPPTFSKEQLKDSTFIISFFLSDYHCCCFNFVDHHPVKYWNRERGFQFQNGCGQSKIRGNSCWIA